MYHYKQDLSITTEKIHTNCGNSHDIIINSLGSQVHTSPYGLYKNVTRMTPRLSIIF